MLSKVFKYDIKALRKTVISLCVVLLSVGTVGFGLQLLADMLSARGDGLALFGLYGFLLLVGVAIVGLLAAGGIAILYRYYRSVFTDEGYLTMTFPVGTHALLLGKMLAAALLALLLAAVAALAYFLAFLLPELLDLLRLGVTEDLFSLLIGDLSYFLPEDPLAVSLSVVSGFSTAVKELVLLYAAITLGATVWKRAKVIGAFLFVFLISVCDSLLSTLLSFLPAVSQSAALSYALSASLSLLVTVIFYFLTYLLLHNKFNIE